MNKIQYRAVICIKVLKAMEVHIEMVNVLNETATSKTVVRKWAGLFKSDCTDLTLTLELVQWVPHSNISSILETVKVILYVVLSQWTRIWSTTMILHHNKRLKNGVASTLRL